MVSFKKRFKYLIFFFLLISGQAMAGESTVSWAELNDSQKQVLNPLASEWDTLRPWQREKMLDIARRKTAGQKITFLEGDALMGLSFPDKSFDVAIASYVAHGLQPVDRQKLYSEMSRVARELVIVHDYNRERSLLTTIVEWMEGGDYFRFIQQAEQEMKDCASELRNCFSEVRVIQVGPRASWYLCKPK